MGRTNSCFLYCYHLHEATGNRGLESQSYSAALYRFPATILIYHQYRIDPVVINLRIHNFENFYLASTSVQVALVPKHGLTTIKHKWIQIHAKVSKEHKG